MKKQIWFLLSFLTIASVIFTWKYWDKVFPIVNLSITMDKKEAIEHARAFARTNQFDISDYDVSVQFKEEGMLQAFVELEGGGKQAFLDMIKNGYYQPYTWVVRFYKHGKISEYIVQFTPEGNLCEFFVKIPESEKGSTLTKDKALEVALRGIDQFAVDMSVYDLVEHNMLTQPSGRIDHTFVYERKDISLEKGKYRIELKVYGDMFAGFERKVKIPDEFIRRYKQMFADNKLLSNVARNIGILIYFFILLFVLALFFIQDRRFLQLKKHAYLGIAFLLIMFLTMVNRWPFLWNFYSTEYSPILFSLNQIGMMLISSLLFSLFVYVLMVLVDAADRYVFGFHIQFLKSWSVGTASSIQVLEMTVLGYLMAVICIGYQVLYNLYTLELGWWSPLGRLVDPNILSSYIPFLSPIGSAFQAGFWEEIVCRGLPLAGIAFLTRDSKYKKWWFLFMMIVQALVFGALHANYPQQPFYNRLVELFIPSVFFFGVLYYFFGLLPGIIMHFVYDAFLMCIPIWVSDLFVQKLLALFCILIPFLIVLVAWYRNKMKFIQAPLDSYNNADRYQGDLNNEILLSRPVGKLLERKHAVLLGIISVIIMAGSYLYLPKDFVNSRSKISSKEALVIAKKAVEKYGFTLSDEYSLIVNFLNNNQRLGNKFVWQTYGKTSYENLEKDYLFVHGWLVIWKKFTGMVEERAETFMVVVGVEGDILGIEHTIPEFRSGADLDNKSAQKIALDLIQETYGRNSKELELVSCESKKHENRRDYLVIYKDLSRYDFKPDLGQARICVHIAGDQLKKIERIVYVPEEWSRQENSRVMQDSVLMTVLLAIGILLISFALFLCIRKNKITIRFLKPLFALTFCYVLIRIFNFFNAWNQILDIFSTAEPLINQVISYTSSYFIYYLFVGFLYITALSFLIRSGSRSSYKANWSRILGLVFIGISLQCIKLSIANISVQMVPLDYECDYVNFKIPALGMLIGYFLNKVLWNSLVLMSVSVLAQKISTFYKILFFIFVGIVISNVASLSNIYVWILSGIFIGFILYILNLLIIFHDIESIFLICFGISLASLLPTVLFVAYPGVVMQVGISSMIFFLFVGYLYRKV